MNDRASAAKREGQVMIADYVYINGEFFPHDQAKVSVFDHGFIYGDGVFEGLQVSGGGIFRLDAHLDRFYRSAKFLEIEIPLPRAELTGVILETARRNNLRDGYMRPVVTRGAGPTGLRNIDKLGRPTLVILAQHESGKPASAGGVTAHVTSIRRVPSECLDSRVKSCNYINNILAYLETKHCGAETAIMLDINGNVSEGYANNIFCVSGGRVLTPPLGNILAGITRDTLLGLCRQLDIPVAEQNLSVYDLITGDEVFESSTLGEIIPISGIDGQPVGGQAPGPITRRLAQELRKLIESGTQSTRVFNA
jgi:branched-chain amino acid aminotransferase